MGSDSTFNVEKLTRFLNKEQETFCLKIELVTKHMKEYIKCCGKNLQDGLQFTPKEVSIGYFILCKWST